MARKSVGFLVALVVGVMLSASPAYAVSIIFDNSDTSSGNLFYDGVGGPMVGTGITFDTITGSSTPLNSGLAGALFCSGCVLNFTTGNNTVEGDSPEWGPGGSFVITGTAIDTQGTVSLLDDVIIASGVLLGGTFVDPNAATGDFGVGGGFDFSGAGTDTKAAGLLEYFGILDPNFIYNSTNISGLGCGTVADNGINCNVLEADVANTSNPVPEPGTMALLGVALLGFARAARRRKK